MIGQWTGAVTRALAVAFLVALPSLMLGGIAADDTQFVLLIAILTAVFVLTEYVSSYPSLIAFRDAPPYNRLRFGAVFLAVLILTVAFRHSYFPSTMTDIANSVAVILSNLSDFPYSPVRLAVLMLPLETPDHIIGAVRLAAGVCYALSILLVAIFASMVYFFNWPSRHGAFNIWINLPMFDATSGGDIVMRLKIHARFNIFLGFLLPFLIPGIVLILSEKLDFQPLAAPQTLIWMMCIWAFVAASMMMRGIAMARVASMIEQKRRSAYGSTSGLQVI